MSRILLFCLIIFVTSATGTCIGQWGGEGLCGGENINPTYEKIYSYYENKEFDKVLDMTLPLCKNNEIIPCKYAAASLIEKEKQCDEMCIEISKKVCDLGEIMDCDFYALYTKNLDKSSEICDNAIITIADSIKKNNSKYGRFGWYTDEDYGFCAFAGNLYQQNRDYKNAIKYYAISCELFGGRDGACRLLKKAKNNEMSYYYEEFVNLCKSSPDTLGCHVIEIFYNKE